MNSFGGSPRRCGHGVYSPNEARRAHPDRGPLQAVRAWPGEITDYLFEEFTSIPLIHHVPEVAVNPKVVGGWTGPVRGWQDHPFRFG